MKNIPQEAQATLNLVRLSALKNDTITQCVNNLMPNDSIVLLDDGCYNHNHPLLGNLSVQKPEVQIYMIAKHATARAIDIAIIKTRTTIDIYQNDNSNIEIQLISMSELVELTFSHQRTITWQC